MEKLWNGWDKIEIILSENEKQEVLWSIDMIEESLSDFEEGWYDWFAHQWEQVWRMMRPISMIRYNWNKWLDDLFKEYQKTLNLWDDLNSQIYDNDMDESFINEWTFQKAIAWYKDLFNEMKELISWKEILTEKSDEVYDDKVCSIIDSLSVDITNNLTNKELSLEYINLNINNFIEDNDMENTFPEKIKKIKSIEKVNWQILWIAVSEKLYNYPFIWNKNVSLQELIEFKSVYKR